MAEKGMQCSRPLAFIRLHDSCATVGLWETGDGGTEMLKHRRRRED